MLVYYFILPFLSSGPSSIYRHSPFCSTPLHSSPLNWLALLDSYPPESKSDSESIIASAAAATLFFAPSKSMRACSHHCRDTLTPVCQVARSQSSRIGRVIIYCATLFCLLVIDFLIPSKPASPIASAKGGYSQLPPPYLRGCLLVIRHVNLCWRLSRACSILGVSTHISAPNTNTVCNTTL